MGGSGGGVAVGDAAVDVEVLAGGAVPGEGGGAGEAAGAVLVPEGVALTPLAVPRRGVRSQLRRTPKGQKWVRMRTDKNAWTRQRWVGISEGW